MRWKGQRLKGGEMGINDQDVAKTRGTCYCFSVLLFDVSFTA